MIGFDTIGFLKIGVFWRLATGRKQLSQMPATAKIFRFLHRVLLQGCRIGFELRFLHRA